MSTQPAPPSAPPSLPDVNAQITPYETVQIMLDQTANFSMLAVPVEGYSDKATLTPNNPNDWFGLNGGYGIDLRSNVHRFEAIAQAHSGVMRVSQELGQQTGKFHCLCLITTDDHQWNPKQLPPP